MADGGTQRNDVRGQLRDAVTGVLIDKIRRDRYPSSTMMDLVEQNLDERQLGAYAQVLLDKIADDRFPSHDIIRRLSKLA